MGFFQDLFGDTAAEAAKTAAAQKVAGINAGITQQQPFYTSGRGAVDTGFGQAEGTVQPLLSSYTGGADLYGDVTGAHGTAGQDRARALFQTDPGYDFTKNEALQATQRATGTGGYQGSGNVLTALQDRAAGLASKQYGDWVSRLQPYLGATSDLTKSLAGLYAGGGTALGGIDLNQGNLLFNAQTGIGNAEAAGTLGEAAARTQAAGNIANLGTKLLGFALAPATGGTSALGSLFGGGNEFGVSDDELYGVGARALQA
jgi:hypothetical protein